MPWVSCRAPDIGIQGLEGRFTVDGIQCIGVFLAFSSHLLVAGVFP